MRCVQWVLMGAAGLIGCQTGSIGKSGTTPRVYSPDAEVGADAAPPVADGRPVDGSTDVDAGRDAAPPLPDAAAPPPPLPDAAVPADARAPGKDARVWPPPDGALPPPPTPDAAVTPNPDAAVPPPPTPDAAVVANPDAANPPPPVPDAAIVPTPDAAIVPTPDAATPPPPVPDAAVVPEVDAAPPPPEPDAAVVPIVDAAAPIPDAAPTCPPPRPPWTRKIPQVGGSVVFNELAPNGTPFIELHNQQAVDMDLSSWTIEGPARFTFPEGTFLPGGAELVIAADPPALAAVAPDAAIVGPLTGVVPTAGRLELYSNTRRLMDSVEIGRTPLFPLPAAGSTQTICKRDPDLGSPPAESWTLSAQAGGTPGASNFERTVAGAATVLIDAHADWRYSNGDGDPLAWIAPDFDDAAWDVAAGPFSEGAPALTPETVRFTVDNYGAVYVGRADGSNLRLVGRDRVGEWDTPEDLNFDAAPDDHLFLAGWEAPGDGGPQMLIGEVVRADGSSLGTSAAGFETVLGPDNANPGGGVALPAPTAAAISAVVAAADAAGAWRAPAAETDKDAGPWGWAVGPVFTPAAHVVWIDTFNSPSVTNNRNTYALFRSRAPIVGAATGTPLPAGAGPFHFRTAFDFNGDPAQTRLALTLLAWDGAAVYLNGVEVSRTGLPDGPLDDGTRALADRLDTPREGFILPSEDLLPGRNVLAITLYAAPDAANPPAAPSLRLDASLRALAVPSGAGGADADVGPGDAENADSDVVLNEIMFHPADSTPGVSAPEFVELYNRGAQPVDLSGWQLVDAVGYAFPAGTVLAPDSYAVVTDDLTLFRETYPDVTAVGAFTGGLGNSGERLALLDACGATQDVVRYSDGARWPAFADGGGSSLELRDPWADNGVGEAWADSDESGRAEWQTVRYRGVAAPSAVGPDGQWQEFVVGLLDAGEVLLDDLHVVEDPDGAATELLQDGTFSSGAAPTWRFLGTHARSAVMPDDTLRLVATGSTEHMHNHAETTLAANRRVTNGRTYEISYRAHWLRGSNQLNTRLYFNRLPQTTLLSRPTACGTPGRRNTAFTAALGPTYRGLQNSPVVPAAGEPTTISITATDPQGVAGLTLHASVDGAAFTTQAMDSNDGRHFTAILPGQPAAALVQFYVEGRDGQDATSCFPAGCADSRALYRVDDGRAAAPGTLHTLRILMSPADTVAFHAATNLMSNDYTGATVVYDEHEVFYDVGVRAKGSERGRPAAPRLGFSVRFPNDHLLRGALGSVSIDRSEGVIFGQRELLMDEVMTHGGQVSGEYNDLVQVVAPQPQHTGPAILQTVRFSDQLLDAQFAKGADGMLFEYELVYYPTTTDNGSPEGYKLPQPDGVVGAPIRGLGANADDPENYRHTYLIKNNRSGDDYSGLIAFAQVFGMGAADFAAHVDAVIDADEWLRALAFASLSGAVDHYEGGAQHNAQFYVRPDDGRVLFFPHDLDFYPGDPRSAIVGNQDLTRLLALPGNTRRFYAHLRDILDTTYNAAYMAHWRDNFARLVPGENWASHYNFLVDRSNWVRTGAANAVSTRFPEVPFEITLNGGLPVGVNTPSIAVTGRAPLTVFALRPVAGSPLPVVFADDGTWSVDVPLQMGLNTLALEALDRRGAVVGADAIDVTRL